MQISSPSSAPMPDAIYVSAAVEGTIDDAVARRLISHVGGSLGPVYGRNGKARLLPHAGGYNEAAKLGPWLVLVDLNSDDICAPLARLRWLPAPANRICFRIVVREIEAWLMADRASLARFLSVPSSVVPAEPEAVDDPKERMVEIARRSRSRHVREDMVPRAGSGRSTGDAYDARLSEFARSVWDPPTAALNSDSLRRAIDCLLRLTQSSGSTRG
jgi:hypothetical protein